MSRLHCPECGLDLDPAVDPHRCPHCGAVFAAVAATDLIIDVRARGADGAPIDPAPAQEPVKARPVFEERAYTGRLWPGGPEVFGRTFVFQSGGPANPNQGRGCCACGCLLMIFFAYIFIEGLRAIF